MVVPFGISVGDFIAVGGLALKVCQVLRNRGATSQYASLIDFLNSLRASMDAISALITGSPTAASLNPDQAFINGIAHQLKCCQRTLEVFLHDSRKYTEKFSRKEGKRVRTLLTEMQWITYRDEDARKLEQRLRGHMEVFQAYLLAVSLEFEAQSASRIESKLDSANHSLSEILATVQYQSKQPKYLGYPWQGDCPGNRVFLEDVLGRPIELPAILCRDLRSFQDTLEIAFRGRPGQQQVHSGDYELVDASQGSLVSLGLPSMRSNDKSGPLVLKGAREWQKKVLPGVRLAMNIILWGSSSAPRNEILPAVDKKCPRCQALNGGERANGFMTCYACALVFRTSRQEYRVDVVNPAEGSGRSDWPQMIFPPGSHKTARPITGLPSKVADPTQLLFKNARAMISSEEPGSTVSVPHAKPMVTPDESASEDLDHRAFRRISYIHQIVIPTTLVGSGYEGWSLSRNPLMQAAGQGNAQWISQILKEGADVAFPDYLGWFALQYAAIAGEKASVELLLQAGSDVNAPPAEYTGRTALQAAAEHGHYAIVELLLLHGANINAPAAEEDGRTALQAAVENGHDPTVDLLLRGGADVNAPACPIEGRTALQCAAWWGSDTAVKRLLTYGADVNASAAQEDGFTALQAAAKQGYSSIVEDLLLNGADVDAPAAPDRGRTALQCAAGNGDDIIVKILLHHGADVNAPAAQFSTADGDSGRTALQAAAENGHDAIVNHLLLLGADVNAPAAQHFGRTALQGAAGNGHHVTVDLLLRHGADINAPATPWYGVTALQAAARGGHDSIVEHLLLHGANVNTPAAPEWGHTALQGAARGGHLATAELLLRQGAGIHAPAASNWGRTALQGAAERGHIAVMELLLRHGADVNDPPALCMGRTALQSATEKGHVDIMELLLRHGANPNAPAATFRGRTAIQAAVALGEPRLVELLVSNGADVDSLPTDMRLAALQAALDSGNESIVKLLRTKRVNNSTPAIVSP
ncbi:MAG: hypothetical protein M1839_009469 [Geoglossum umbratile]|nr:MAG: hypothetical protein M1839_009469 [Geoglossum umbratile]